MPGKVDYGGQEEDEVDDHEHQDGDMEEKESFEANILNEAGRGPYIWFYSRTSRKKKIQAKQNDCECSSETPGKDREEDKLGERRTSLTKLGGAEGSAEIKTEDCHPAEHGDADKVTKVTEESTEEWDFCGNIINNNDVEGDQEDAGNIAHNNLPMKVEEVWNRNIDNEGDDKSKKADNAEDGEENVVLHIILVTHHVLLALEHHDVPGHVLHTNLHTVCSCVSIPLMVQAPLPPHQEALPWLQQVEGGAVLHISCLVQGQEVWCDGDSGGKRKIPQHLL